MKRFVLVILSAVCGWALRGAVTADSVYISFRQSHIDVDRDFESNGQRLDSIFSRLTQADTVTHTRRSLRGVSVVGAASPEGSVSFNRWLSERRADAIFDIFRSRGFATDTLASFTFLGRDWEGLRQSVLADGEVPSRAAVLSLLDDIVEHPATVANPLQRLKAIDGGVPYQYLYRRHFPALRRSALVVEYDQWPVVATIPSVPAAIANSGILPREPEIEPVALPAPRRPWYMALKTNMLLDALLVPNIGAEIYVGRGFSITADWMYGWWDKDPRHDYWRLYGGMAGARWYFGGEAARKPLQGHHIGIFAGAVTWDFELGGTGYMGGSPGQNLWYQCTPFGAVEYGYSLPVAHRLNIDFSIAIGYLGGKYLKYMPKDGYYEWQSTHRLHWVGPVKAEISLVWLIGRGNTNTKGGLR